MSSNTISRLKAKWLNEYHGWHTQDLSNKRYVYSEVRMDEKLCLLVIIGVTEHGHKELVAVEDGCRESEASWSELLVGLQQRGLTFAPKLAVGDGALGFLFNVNYYFRSTRSL